MSKTIVFDFDGTIVDSMEQLADLAAEIMSKAYDLSWKTARQKYIETSGLPFCEQLEQIFPKNPKNKEAAFEFESSKKNWYMDSPLFNNTRSSLDALRKRGYNVAVSSNNHQELVDSLLEKHGLKVDVALGYRSAEFSKGKPHFDFISKKFSCPASDIVFVGDSLKDGERADKSSVKFIGKAGLFTKAQFKKAFPDSTVIEQLSELEKIL